MSNKCFKIPDWILEIFPRYSRFHSEENLLQLFCKILKPKQYGSNTIIYQADQISSILLAWYKTLLSLDLFWPKTKYWHWSDFSFNVFGMFFNGSGHINHKLVANDKRFSHWWLFRLCLRSLRRMFIQDFFLCKTLSLN